MGQGGSSRSARGGASVWLEALHDLRQPLQSALLLLAALDGEDDAARRSRVLHGLETSLLGLQSMIEQLAVVSRVEDGKAMLVAVACDLLGTATMALKDAAAAIDHDRVELRGTAGECTAVADRRMLCAMMQSLLHCALAHSTGPVAAVCGRRPREVVFEVAFESDAMPAAALTASFMEAPAGHGRPVAYVVGPGLAARMAACHGGRLDHHRDTSGRHRLSLTLPTTSSEDGKKPAQRRPQSRN